MDHMDTKSSRVHFPGQSEAHAEGCSAPIHQNLQQYAPPPEMNANCADDSGLDYGENPDYGLNYTTIDECSDPALQALVAVLTTLCEQQACNQATCANSLPKTVICKKISSPSCAKQRRSSMKSCTRRQISDGCKWHSSNPPDPTPHELQLQCVPDEQSSYEFPQVQGCIPSCAPFEVPYICVPSSRSTCNEETIGACGPGFGAIRTPACRRRPMIHRPKPLMVSPTPEENLLAPPLILSVKGAVLKQSSISSFFVNPPHQLHSFRCQSIHINQYTVCPKENPQSTSSIKLKKKRKSRASKSSNKAKPKPVASGSTISIHSRASSKKQKPNQTTAGSNSKTTIELVSPSESNAPVKDADDKDDRDSSNHRNS